LAGGDFQGTDFEGFGVGREGVGGDGVDGYGACGVWDRGGATGGREEDPGKVIGMCEDRAA
jgi:hypothetical protein